MKRKTLRCSTGHGTGTGWPVADLHTQLELRRYRMAKKKDARVRKGMARAEEMRVNRLLAPGKVRLAQLRIIKNRKRRGFVPRPGSKADRIVVS